MDEIERNPENVLKILVATDIHLGFAEKEPERADDTFNTFEEILSLAKERDVDFILLGGDLFHENKPSRFTFNRCIQLLRKYTFGNKRVNFEIVNERDKSSAPFLPYKMNYEDPNVNVSYPVFSIHGNHDDPTGRGCLCSLDLLSEMGLVNHFGKCLNLESIEIKPLLFQKGKTKLALYGLGAIRDQRLYRIFREGKVSMIRPSEFLKEWFNVFVVHQNRTKHSPTGYLPEEYLEDFLDLVIWGHEHECLITPQQSTIRDLAISQPGSSVATSLSVGEAVQKCVGILHIHEQDYLMEEIPLRTVRPFCIEDISLEKSSLDLQSGDRSSKVMEYCYEYVERMIQKSREQLSGHEKQPEIPLIRLRVEFSNDEETFSVVRFGQKFLNKVANAKDLIMFQRKRQNLDKNIKVKPEDILKANENDLARFSAVELVRQHFESAVEGQQLEILTEKGLGKAVQEYVDKKEYEAISKMIEHQRHKTVKFLINGQVNEENIDDELARFKQDRQKIAEEEAELNQVLAAAKKMRIEKGGSDSGEEMDANNGELDDDDSNIGDGNANSKQSGQRGRGRARGPSRGRGRGRGSSSKNTVDSVPSTARSSHSKERSSRGRGGGSSGVGSSRDSQQQQLTISGMLQPKRTSNVKDITYIDIDDSDDDEIQIPSSKRRKTKDSSSLSSKTTQKLKYCDDDDDDVIPVSFSSKR